MIKIHRPLIALMALLAASFPLAPAQAAASVRLKDIVDFQGARENMLIGYGLVVGLNGTGDDLTEAIFTSESLVGMLERLGVNARNSQLRTKDVAAVMVTATLPAFSRTGSHIDITVSALGSSQSLQGGTLVVTPLMGADGEVYAVAQGQVTIGGFVAKGAATSVTKGTPTAGKIANGALVEREVPFELSQLQNMNIALRNPDFTTAQRVATAINGYMRGHQATATDPGTISLDLNGLDKGAIVQMITNLEQLRIEPDEPAKVVIDETNGIIVMGENVRISTVAVAEGNLTVRITETPQVSQPGPFSGRGATTQVVPKTDIKVDEDSDRRLAVLPKGVSIQELVNDLNALGIGPRDMIAILQSIKAAGAMQADLEVR